MTPSLALLFLACVFSGGVQCLDQEELLAIAAVAYTYASSVENETFSKVVPPWQCTQASGVCIEVDEACAISYEPVGAGCPDAGGNERKCCVHSSNVTVASAQDCDDESTDFFPAPKFYVPDTLSPFFITDSFQFPHDLSWIPGSYTNDDTTVYSCAAPPFEFDVNFLYHFVVHESRQITIDLCPTSDQTIFVTGPSRGELYCADNCPNSGTCVTHNETLSGCSNTAFSHNSVTFCSLPFREYVFRVTDLNAMRTGFSGSRQVVTWKFGAPCQPPTQCGQPDPPLNNHCYFAETIPLPGVTLFTPDDAFATPDYFVAQTSCGASPAVAPFSFAGPTLWFRILGTGTTHSVTISAEAAHDLRVYCGECDDNLICVNGVQSTPPAPTPSPTRTSSISWCTRPGEVYLIQFQNAQLQPITGYSASRTEGAFPCVATDGCMGTPPPTPFPTPFPTPHPTPHPTPRPTLAPTRSPSRSPTTSPSQSPTSSPTEFVGACCLRDATCESLTPAECAERDGTFGGGFVECAAISCLGACCTRDFECVDALTREQCTLDDAYYFGETTTCAEHGGSCEDALCDGPSSGDECDCSAGDLLTLPEGESPFCTTNATRGDDVLGELFGLDVWYRHCVTCTGALVVRTCNSTVFANVGIYKEGECDDVSDKQCPFGAETTCQFQLSLPNYICDGFTDQCSWFGANIEDRQCTSAACEGAVTGVACECDCACSPDDLNDNAKDCTGEISSSALDYDTRSCADGTDGIARADVCVDDVVLIRLGSGSLGDINSVLGGAGVVDIECVEGCINDVDECVLASETTDGTTPFCTYTATNSIDDGLVDVSCPRVYRDVWFAFDATCTGTLVVRYCSVGGFAATFVLYAERLDGECADHTNLLACTASSAGEECGGGGAFLSVPATSGDRFRLQVGAQEPGDVTFSEEFSVECVPDVRACCLPDEQPCVDAMDVHDCALLGGHAADSCGLCDGACCYGSGLCEQQARALCEQTGGVFAGADTSCSEGDCTRPCCFGAGAAHACTELDDDACIGQGGTPHGRPSLAGGSCDTDACPGTTVCCAPSSSDTSGACSVTTPSYCLQMEAAVPVFDYDSCADAAALCDTLYADCCLPDVGGCERDVSIAHCLNVLRGTVVADCKDAQQCSAQPPPFECAAHAEHEQEPACVLRDELAGMFNDGCAHDDDVLFIDATCTSYCGTLSTHYDSVEQTHERDVDEYLLRHKGGALEVQIRSDVPACVRIYHQDDPDDCATRTDVAHQIGCSYDGVSISNAHAAGVAPGFYVLSVSVCECDGTPINEGYECDSHRHFSAYSLHVSGNCHDEGAPGACCTTMDGGAPAAHDHGDDDDHSGGETSGASFWQESSGDQLPRSPFSERRYCVDQLTAEECHGDIGGVFQGGGSTCLTAQKQCAALTGACCVSADALADCPLPVCTPAVTPEQCRLMYGVFTEFGADCRRCPQEPLCVHISGRVYDDVNRNAQYDVGEHTLSGVYVELRAGNDILATSETSATGAYEFGALPANTYVNGAPYVVRVVDSILLGTREYELTTPSDRSAPCAVDQCVSENVHFEHVDFFYRALYYVRGAVVLDQNGNGQRDAAEPGIAGVYVDVVDKNGEPVATLVSDAHGRFEIEGLPNSGSPYSFSENDPAGCTSAPSSNVLSSVHVAPGIDVSGLYFLDECA